MQIKPYGGGVSRGRERPLLFTKIKLVMKLTTILFLGVFLHLSAATRAQLINYSARSVKLETAFEAIKKQTEYVFFYDDADMKAAQPVTVRLKSASLSEALSMLLANQPFSYEIQGKTVVVTANPKSRSLFPLTFQDKGLVKGAIVSLSGQPLAGATITVRNKSITVFTDGDGRFSINASDMDILEISYVGYSRVVVQAAKLAGLEIGQPLKMPGSRFTKLATGGFIIELEPSITSLEATVVTGYQILKKSSVAGAVSYIKGDELYLNGISTIEQALQGKLPGVVITNSSGLTGVRQRTRVRGTSTLLGTQEPIWVVDGIIQEDPLPFKASTFNALGDISTDNFDYIRNFVGSSIGWLNPNDIEDITVLKDASATAIYGVRAANGVIVITTKKGRPGPATVNYSVNMNTAERVSYDRLEMMNSKQRVAVSKEIFERGLVSSSIANNVGYAGALSDYLNKNISEEEFIRRVSRMETVNTDWFDMLFRIPFSMNHNLSISGGNANTRYYASFGYNQTNGTAIGNDSKAYSGNINITSRLTSKLNVSLRLSTSSKTTNGFYLVNPYDYASKVNRALEAYTEAGDLAYYTASSGFKYNFLNEQANTGLRNNQLSANTGIDLTYEVLPGLRFQTMFGYSVSDMRGESYATERTEYIARKRNYDYGTVKPTDQAYIDSRLPEGGEYNSDQNLSTSWNWRNSLSFSKVFAEKHAFTIMVGQEANNNRVRGSSSTSYGYMYYRGKSFITLPLTYTSNKFANTLFQEFKNLQIDKITNNLGLYATMNYVYDNRYVLNASVRSDASNRFGQYTREKFNPVWAGGLRWNVAREKWFERNMWLADLSLRSSFGYQRNIVAGVSPDLILRVPTGSQSSIIDQFTGESMLTLSKLPYADLRWEKNTSINLGIDLSLFRGKVQTTVDYYWKMGRDLITNLPVPVEYGVETMPVNGGDMVNRGIEVSASFVPVRTRDFTWSINMNTAKNFNQIQRTGTQLMSWKTAASGNFYKAGYPVTGFWAFDFKGINPENGYPQINLAVAKGQDSINDPTSYMRYMGKLDPDFTAGLGMMFRYKQFTVSASFNLQVGGKKFLVPAYGLSPRLPMEYENLSTELLGRWTPSNKAANFPGLPDNTLTSFYLPNKKVTSNVYEMYNYSSARVVDASNFQCNSLALSYNLPAHLVRKLKCSNLNIGGGVSQLFSIVSKDFKGRDAEVATGAQPRTRSYTMSASVSF